MRPVTANNNFNNIDTDKIISFCSGDFLATLITTQTIIEMDWIHPTLKLIFIVLGGFFGGFFGLLGQRVFKYFEKKYDNTK